MSLTTDYKSYQKGAIFKGAPHMEKRLTKKEAKTILKYHSALYLRNVYDFDCQEKTNFWFIINDTTLELKDLSSRCRNKVRKAYKTFDYRPISKEDMINQGGYEVYKSSWSRYKTTQSQPLVREKWVEHMLNNSEEYYGAFDKESGTLVAYCAALIQNESAKYTELKANPDHLRYYPFYGLIFYLNHLLIDERKMLYVTDGARTISEHSNIQPFLEQNFLFRKAYCHLKAYYPWYIGLGIKLLRPLGRLLPEKGQYLLKLDSFQRPVSL